MRHDPMRSPDRAGSLLRTLLLASGILSTPLSSASQSAPDGRIPISREQCESGAFDHRERFPEEGNQGPQGQCFAFAAAGVFDEHACATDSRLCGTRHSPIDIARSYPPASLLNETIPRPVLNSLGHFNPRRTSEKRDYFNLGSMVQGGFEYEIIEAALEHGVCPETRAPWFPAPPVKGPFDETDPCVTTKERSTCVIETLRRLWHRHSRLMPPSRFIPDIPLSKQKTAKRIRDKMRRVLEVQVREGGLDVDWALEVSTNEFKFIENVLIPPACEENRVEFKGPLGGEMWVRVWQGTPIENSERMQELIDAVQQTRRSTVLALCSTRAMDRASARKDDSRDEFCGPHAVVANGLRWNTGRNRCEIHIRNSWGIDVPLRGWLPVEPVLNSTFRISGIHPSP